MRDVERSDDCFIGQLSSQGMDKRSSGLNLGNISTRETEEKQRDFELG
jgi:hypothetical protein